MMNTPPLLRSHEFYAGLLTLLIGLAAAAKSATYPVGTLLNMGPGYFPLMIGCIMTFIGLLQIATMVMSTRRRTMGRPEIKGGPDLRGAACIVLAILSFVSLSSLGFLPACFGCVFIAAIGDRTMSFKGAALLAIAVTALGVLLFSYGLQLSMPLIGG